MPNELTEKEKHVLRTLSNYFKVQGITHKEIAERLGYSSKNVVDNQLSYGTFGKKIAAKWAAEFGFNEKFLMTGKGQLFERQTGYRKLATENQTLKTVIRMQTKVIQNLKRGTVPVLIMAVALLFTGTRVAAMNPIPGDPDATAHALILLTNEENAIYDIVFQGPGKGSPEHKAASDRYCALQAFVRLAVHYEKDVRYKVVTNPDTGTEAVVDTITGKTMLQSKGGKLVSYDKELDAKTFIIDD